MKIIRSTVALSVSLGLLSACGSGSDSTSTLPAQDLVDDNDQVVLETIDNPTISSSFTGFTDVSVHDPSVLAVTAADNTKSYYIFGSHMASAKTTDWVNWVDFDTSNDTASNNNEHVLWSSLFLNTDSNTGAAYGYVQQVQDGVLFANDANGDGVVDDALSVDSDSDGVADTTELGSVGMWAPDVIQLSDGKFYFYYDHCNTPTSGECDNYHSYLGVARADNVEGPYEDLGLILTTGNDVTSGINGEQWDDQTNPNGIDPTVFFDAENRLWMVYGSYAGGIWIMELDPSTGFPLDYEEGTRSYGTHLTGGYYSAIEGPYIMYSPETEYYYLFTSYGGYDSNGGYNVRVSRSTSPDGPYVDMRNQDMLGMFEDESLISDGVLATDETASYGVKVVGSHTWSAGLGEVANTVSYYSPGHNSAYYDEETGKHFMVFHTRFSSESEGHQVRVHELLMNEYGWPVLAPFRYVPTEGSNIVDYEDVVGDYQFLFQDQDTNTTPHESVYVSLTADNQISGAYTGTYSIDNDGNLKLIIDDLGTFRAKATWQYNENLAEPQLVPTFSGYATVEATTLWGAKLPDLDASEVMNDIADAASAEIPTETVFDLNLSTSGARGATITWSSSDEGVINSSTGTVTRPAVGEDDASVTLSATVTLVDGTAQSYTYTVNVPARVAYNRIATYSFDGNLSDSWTSDGATSADATLSGWFVFDSAETTTPTYSSDAKSGQAIELGGNDADNNLGYYGVVLDSALSLPTYTISMWVKPDVITQYTPAFFANADASNWLGIYPQGWSVDGSMVWSFSEQNNGAWNDVISSEGIIPVNEWTHIAFTYDGTTGVMFVNGVQVASLSNFNDIFSDNAVQLALGVNFWDTPFNGLIDEVKLYDDALSAAEIRALDVEMKSDNELISAALDAVVEELSTQGITELRGDLSLSQEGPFTSTVSWASNNESVIATDGTVTRPGEGESAATVVLTASVTLNGETQTVDIEVTVMPVELPDRVAAYSFESSLEDSNGTYNTGTITGRLLSSTASYSEALYDSGINGQGVYLDGSYGVILGENVFNDDTYTISVWLKPEALTSYSAAVFGYEDGDVWFSFVPYSWASDYYFWLWAHTAAGYVDNSFGQTLTEGEWVHAVLSVSGSKATVFLNGEQVNEITTMPTLFDTDTSNYLSIGANFWDVPYQGMLDELVIYDEAIGEAEAQAIYNQYKNNR